MDAHAAGIASVIRRHRRSDRRVREMTATRTRVEESIHVDAPPSAVFDYCLDPRQLFAADPKHVVDAQLAPGGVGTTAHLSMKLGVLEEHDRLEYVEVVPDRRIEIAMQPTMSPRGLARPHHETALYSLIHEFAPEGHGTVMTLRVQVHDAPLYERMIDRLEGKGAEKMVHNRLQRIAKAVEGAAAGE
jgi:uncharacterized protein YndB with AHSA1/START domain